MLVEPVAAPLVPSLKGLWHCRRAQAALLPAMSTKSRQTIYGGSIMGADRPPLIQKIGLGNLEGAG